MQPYQVNSHRFSADRSEVHRETLHTGLIQRLSVRCCQSHTSHQTGSVHSRLDSINVGVGKGGNSCNLLRLQGSQSPLERNELKVRHFGLEREKHPSDFSQEKCARIFIFKLCPACFVFFFFSPDCNMNMLQLKAPSRSYCLCKN